MTSASELFCSRRSRGSDWSYSQHYLSSRNGNQSDRIFGTESHHRINRRALLSKMPAYRSGQEQPDVEEGTIGYNPANNDIAGVSSIRSRPSIACNQTERLPGNVLQAKERLLRRLGGAAVSDRSSINVNNQRNCASDSNFQLVDAVDWEPEFDPFLLAHSKKDPRICLKDEIFKSTNIPNDNNNAISWDCCICLERFSIGNKLTRLLCNHRFHQDCLRQWIQIRGDCPCCRSSVF